MRIIAKGNSEGPLTSNKVHAPAGSLTSLSGLSKSSDRTADAIGRIWKYSCGLISGRHLTSSTEKYDEKRQSCSRCCGQESNRYKAGTLPLFVAKFGVNCVT